MNDKLVLDFLNFPATLDEFPTYENQIHSEINSTFTDSSSYLLSVMKDVDKVNRKRLFKLKKSLHKLKTSFDLITSSAAHIQTVDDTHLTFHHELIITLDFLLMSRLSDCNEVIRSIEQALYEPDAEEVIAYRIKRLHDAQAKLADILQIRKMAHKIAPSDTLIEKFASEFRGEISYLNTVGAIKDFTELKKPLLLGKKEYREELAKLFLNLCNEYIKKDINSTSFTDFYDTFTKKYINVEFDLSVMDKVSSRLNKIGLLSIEEKEDGSKNIVFQEDLSLQNEIMKLAEAKGFLTPEKLMNSLGKSIEDIQKTIGKMEQAGVVITDDEYASGTRYYFPGLYTDKDNEEHD